MILLVRPQKVGWALAHSRQAKKEIVCLTY
ncbi:Uncharacterised protein [Legionella lansingensis]|nr:Uncharacterised protein [Legionella lansingensis]